MSTKITLQQVFNAAWQAFVKEKKSPGVNQSTGELFYADDDNNRCAIGLVLTDEQLDKIDALSDTDVPSVQDLVTLFPDWFDFNVDNIGSTMRSLIARKQHLISILGNPENGPVPAAFKVMSILLHDSIIVKQADGRYGWSTLVGECSGGKELELYYRQFAHTYGFTIPGE